MEIDNANQKLLSGGGSCIMYKIKVRFARDSSFEVTLTAPIYGLRLRLEYIKHLDRGC